jgi:hypothetical protein
MDVFLGDYQKVADFYNKFKLYSDTNREFFTKLYSTAISLL